MIKKRVAHIGMWSLRYAVYLLKNGVFLGADAHKIKMKRF